MPSPTNNIILHCLTSHYFLVFLLFSIPDSSTVLVSYSSLGLPLDSSIVRSATYYQSPQIAMNSVGVSWNISLSRAFRYAWTPCYICPIFLVCSVAFYSMIPQVLHGYMYLGIYSTWGTSFLWFLRRIYYITSTSGFDHFPQLTVGMPNPIPIPNAILSDWERPPFLLQSTLFSPPELVSTLLQSPLITIPCACEVWEAAAVAASAVGIEAAFEEDSATIAQKY